MKNKIIFFQCPLGSVVACTEAIRSMVVIRMILAMVRIYHKYSVNIFNLRIFHYLGGYGYPIYPQYHYPHYHYPHYHYPHYGYGELNKQLTQHNLNAKLNIL